MKFIIYYHIDDYNIHAATNAVPLTTQLYGGYLESRYTSVRRFVF